MTQDKSQMLRNFLDYAASQRGWEPQFTTAMAHLIETGEVVYADGIITQISPRPCEENPT